MTKHIPTYQEYVILTEGSEVFRMAERYRFDNMKWSFDQKAKDELIKQHLGSSNAKVYTAQDKERNRKYEFQTWVKNLEFYILLLEDGVIIYNQAYPIQDRRYFDQDCEMILGFEIKDDK
jgi:hypothetical protein